MSLVLPVVALGAIGLIFAATRKRSSSPAAACQLSDAMIAELDALVQAGEPTALYAVPWPGAPVSVQMAGWAYWQARQALAATTAQPKGVYSQAGAPQLVQDTAKALESQGAKAAALWLLAADQCRNVGVAAPPPPDLVGL